MRTIAAFDFDGTLTYHDTLLPFLCHKKALWGLPRALLSVPFCRSRQEVKEAILTHTLGGRSYEACRGDGFVPQLRPEAMAKLRWHQAQGHETVLLSANLDLYLEPWGKKEGFTATLTSQVAQERGVVTGKLIGLNCWGQEKVRRLLAWAGPKESFLLWAYGDTHGGDGPLLKLADYPFFRHFCLILCFLLALAPLEAHLNYVSIHTWMGN